MKKLLSILFILAFHLCASAQGNPEAMRAKANEPLCGLCAAFNSYREEGHIKTGLAVDMLVGSAQLNQPITLRFFVNQRPKRWPDDNLEIEHEKYMHVIGVRDDLGEFFHVHPVKTGPGNWTITHTFTNAGNYKIWTDVRSHGVSYTFGHPLLNVSGTPAKVETNYDFQEQVIVSGYHVALKHSGPWLINQANLLQFTVADASGNEIKTENFLGAAMHLVIVKNDLSVYLHAHADLPIGGDAGIRFHQAFPVKGIYKLFAQFRPAGTKLPPDEFILAEFYVNATDANPAPTVLTAKKSP